MDITKLADLPESKTLEFKRDASSLDSILKAVVAFANTAGGIILIGVEDDGAIVGLANPGKDQEKIVNTAIPHPVTRNLQLTKLAKKTNYPTNQDIVFYI